MVGRAGRIGEFDLCAVVTAKTPVGSQTRGTRWVDLMAAHLAEQLFDRCGAAPQSFANYELDVFQANLSQKIRFKIWTVNQVGMRYEHLKRERMFSMTGM